MHARNFFNNGGFETLLHLMAPVRKRKLNENCQLLFTYQSTFVINFSVKDFAKHVPLKTYTSVPV